MNTNTSIANTSISNTSISTGTGHVSAGDVDLWVERRGAGPDVLLIAGLSDPAEAWTFQLEGLADRYHLTAFDNRGAGRSPLPREGITVRDMADDAAALLRRLGVTQAHVAGISAGAPPRKRDGESDHRRGIGVPAPAVARGVPAPARGVDPP
jgi:hypothetical protein